MPRYLVMGTYSQEGMSAAMEEGFASREEAVRPLIEAMGGTLEAMHFCSPGAGFNFVIQMTAPNADVAYSMSVMGTANSAFANGGQVVELKTGAEADAVLANAAEAHAKYRAPGEASA